MPLLAMTSASLTFAHVTPIAPASIKRCASAGTLMPLVCGRHDTPACRNVPAIRSTFRSNASRLTSNAGVSSSSTVKCDGAIVLEDIAGMAILVKSC